MLRFCLSSIFVQIIILNSYSQVSNLGRFEVNVNKGCVPLFIEVINENVDTSATVIQYDFNYEPNNPIFNPSSNSKNIYSNSGKYIIAQAINVDNIEKIDFIEIEVFESKVIDFEINNCRYNQLEINIIDDYYEGYNLYINDSLVESLNSGINNLDYERFLNSENKFDGLIKGKFSDSDESCYEVTFSISSIKSNSQKLIDSVIVSDDRSIYSLFYRPEKSTNYSLKIDGKSDSIFLTNSTIDLNDHKIYLKSKTYSDKHLSIEKKYKCQNEIIEDRIFLLYLNSYEVNNGIKIDLSYEDEAEFDSVHVMKDNKLISESKESIIDKNNLIKGKEYCYRVFGYKDGKKSISNQNCLVTNRSYNPIPVPNAFSPNADGINDVFKPFEIKVSNYSLEIYDKNGINVFKSNDIKIGWDGFYNGKVNQGSYIYIIKCDMDDKNVNQKGKFLLLN